MKGGEWIEQIRVRSTAAALDQALPALRDQVEAIDASLPSVQPFFLQHALYAGDLAVVLVWQPDVVPEKTREGLHDLSLRQQPSTVGHPRTLRPADSGFARGFGP